MYTSLPLTIPYPVITPSDGVSLVLMLRSVLLALTKAPISTKLLSSRIESILDDNSFVEIGALVKAPI